MGFKSYFTGEDLTEGNEAVADETRYEVHIFVCNSDMNTTLSKIDFEK